MKLQIGFVFLALCVWQFNDTIREQVDTFCVKQSDTPKYVVHVMEESVSKKNRQAALTAKRLRTLFTEEPCQKTCRRLPESRNRRYYLEKNSARTLDT